MAIEQHIYTKLNWEFGSGYDLFISLRVLHAPETYGLRASWASSVRMRMSVEHRQTLEWADSLLFNPMYFVHHLPAPKSAKVVLDALGKLPAPRRIEALFQNGSVPSQFFEVLSRSSAGKKWTKAEKDVITAYYVADEQDVTATFLDRMHQAWAYREEFGNAYLSALQSYYETFFEEEEKRILPVLRQALSYAQMRSGSLSIPAMLEELTAGVRYGELSKIKELYLAPSFWGTPFLIHESLGNDVELMLFGARPDTMNVIPGDIVPDTLINGLKALSDSTRLRILRCLAQAPQTSAQLSRVLRLRPPTVSHHLQELRIAGLVQVIVNERGQRQYATRFDGFENVRDLLTRFVHGD